MKTVDKAELKERLIKLKAEMLTERSTLSNTNVIVEMNGQDIKPREIAWFTRQAAELSKLIEALEEEGT